MLRSPNVLKSDVIISRRKEAVTVTCINYIQEAVRISRKPQVTVTAAKAVQQQVPPPGSKSSTSSNRSNYSSGSYSSYDDGYEDVYENDDYDWDRYYSDDDYADGVDDAMDELDW